MDYSTGDDDNNSEITATIADEDKAEVPERTLPDKITVTPEFLRKKQEDEVLSDIMFETEAYFGRPLSMPESESLIYIYDQLGFSQEAYRISDRILSDHGQGKLQICGDRSHSMV